MKKITKAFLIISLALIVCLSSIPVFASEADAGISPRLSHMGSGKFVFSTDSNGGHVTVTYEGYPDTFVQARVTVKLQKRFLLVFWNDVDEWTTTSTELFGFLSHTFALNGTGTYKATMTLEVTGTDGTVDVITDSIESTY